ncbi:MAG: MATE family efflux transporter [Lachnospiraceae bacterium]|nr:MATE family efflux transporter [Lachnospiraceae bacterium]
MDETKVNENKMGVMPVNKLLITMSLPMMISMLVQALYNIVDSIFVARIEEKALTAVSLAFPIQTLMIAVGVGTAVGVNALLSRFLGEKEFEKADDIAKNGIFLAVLSYLLFLLIGIFAVKIFYASQTTDPVINEYGKEYLTIICVASLGIFMQSTFEKLLQATGKTFYAMITQGTGAIINIILDPILIFGYFGMPKMGVAGAAVATVIGQCVAAVLAVVFNVKVNKEIHINMKGFKPNGKAIRHIYMIGIPSIIMQAIGSVMTYGMNRILIAFTDTATAVFGAYFKLQSFVFMPVFGLNNGLVSILAYNYGAGNRERVVRAFKLAACYAVVIMAVGIVLMQCIPDKLLLLFEASETMLAIGVPALRTISTCFIVAAVCIVAGSLFQALGHAWYSMIISVCRQLLVLLPVAYLLSLTGELQKVWWAFPIAEVMSACVTAFFLVRIWRRVVVHIGE